MTATEKSRIYFVWGLKRSGIHFFVNWLYGNLGAKEKRKIRRNQERHPQLQKGFFDQRQDVWFFNNCGGVFSRQYALGPIADNDFVVAAESDSTTIFGIEDADFSSCNTLVPQVSNARHILIMRDPLNNMASRLRGLDERPDIFPTDSTYVRLFDIYSQEFLGLSHHLPSPIFVNFNKMTFDRDYRDSLANEMGLKNMDVVDKILNFGGGSSFTGTQQVEPQHLLKRYEQCTYSREIIEALLTSLSIPILCNEVFGYNLAAVAKTLQVD